MWIGSATAASASDVLRHYGRCYWELSKARLRCTVASASNVLRHYGRCYWELSKARLSALVLATSGAGYVLGSGSIVDIAGLCYTCTGTMMVAASANTFNQVFEVKNDAKMKRTMRRPLPSGRISPVHAAMWATSVGAAGTTLLVCKANYLAAGLAASNLIMYAFVYTPLKQIHHVNTWVYRMLSFADPSGKRTAWVSLKNCLYMLPLGYLHISVSRGLTSGWFCFEASLLTTGLTIGALSFVLDPTHKSARRMFHGSLLYLPALMAGLILHRLPNQ
ncbi:hypothetical protein CFC21_005143 [Triticum aestivum]|uniref:Heme O synthase n=2 Tax=Triticum aestivum TaxID=4565 RepID=A0A9R1D971_WHEAT|nr:hypothetical protein CFC21_005143 [Triticum aestivum]